MPLSDIVANWKDVFARKRERGDFDVLEVSFSGGRAQPPREIAPGHDYVSMRVLSAFIPQLQLTGRHCTCIRSRVELPVEGGDPVEYERLVAPSFLRRHDARNADKVMLVNQPLAGPSPFSGRLDFEIGVFRFPAVNYLDDFLGFLDTVSKEIPLSFVDNAKTVTKILSHGADVVFGAVGDESLELGIGMSFDDENAALWTGPRVILPRDGHGLDREALSLHPRTMRLLQNDAPVESVPYLAVSVDARRRRRDWNQIPSLREAFQALRAAAAKGDETAIASFVERFDWICRTSPDLTQEDATRISDYVVSRFGVQHQTTVALDAETSLALETLEVFGDKAADETFESQDFESIFEGFESARREYPAAFDAAMAFVAGWEGGLADFKEDRGGLTNLGVTQKTYDAYRADKNLPPQSVRDLTKSEAVAIYFENYWEAVRGSEVAYDLALTLFDAGVNHGPGRSIKFMQRTLGVVVDGGFGPRTMAAVRDAELYETIANMCDLREAFYRRLVARDNSQERFIRGWMNRLNALRSEVQVAGLESVILIDDQADPAPSLAEMPDDDFEALLEAAHAATRGGAAPAVAPVDDDESDAESDLAPEPTTSLESQKMTSLAEMIVNEAKKSEQGLNYQQIEQFAGMAKARSSEVEKAIGDTLKELRSMRAFESLVALCSALLSQGVESARILRMQAQGYIDLGLLDNASVALERLLSGYANDKEEYFEGRGLMGRLMKQRYVESAAEAGSGRLLQNAIDWYYEAYTERPYSTWHGVNSIALMQRAIADEVEIKQKINPSALAQILIAHVEAKPTKWAWDYATTAQAALALPDYEYAAEQYQKHIEAPDATPFMLAGAVRQLEEVWSITEDHPEAGPLLTALKAELLSKPGGAVTLVGNDEIERFERGLSMPKTEKIYEKLHGAAAPKPVSWMLKGLGRRVSIAAIEQNLYGDWAGFGTGFLMDGGDLAARWSGRLVLITNEHVLSDRPRKDDIAIENARAVFQAVDKGNPVSLRRILFSSPREEHDVTVLEIEESELPDGATPIRDFDAPLPRRREGAKSIGEVMIMGHPNGRVLSISLENTLLVDHDAPGDEPADAAPVRLHYKTPTEPGNSGSPIFIGGDWSLAGVHHAGGYLYRLDGSKRRYQVNQGIWIKSIRAAIAEAFPSDAPIEPVDDGFEALTPDVLGDDNGGDVEPDDVVAATQAPEPEPAFERALPSTAPASPAALWYPRADRSVEMPTKGYYADQYPKGAIVHFTAGRFEHGLRSARATMRYGAEQTYSFFCIARAGEVFQPAALNRWGSHAGRSWHPRLGHWVSTKLVGVEIAGAGKLTQTEDGFEPWWNAGTRGAKTKIPEADVRFADFGANVRDPGPYHAFSMAQEEALIDLLLWLKANNPKVFDFDLVLGHDEVATLGRPGAANDRSLGRKNDPGGSLRWTMPAFREELKRRAAIAAGS